MRIVIQMELSETVGKTVGEKRRGPRNATASKGLKLFLNWWARSDREIAISKSLQT